MKYLQVSNFFINSKFKNLSKLEQSIYEYADWEIPLTKSQIIYKYLDLEIHVNDEIPKREILENVIDNLVRAGFLEIVQ